jgi:GntR family transcriptional regulator
MLKSEAAKRKPLNLEVKAILLRYIDENVVGGRNKLPSEERLSKELGVSRITLRSALTELSQEGVIYRRHGLGTYVNTDVVELKHSFNPMLEFDRIIRSSGYSPRIDVVDIDSIIASDDYIDRLRLESGDRVKVMKKIVYADDIPSIFCMDIVSEKMIGEGIGKSDYEKSVFKLIESTMNKHIVRGIAEISTVLSSQMLEFKDYVPFMSEKPMLLYEYVSYDDENTPVVYGKIFYDTSMVDFSITRKFNTFIV